MTTPDGPHKEEFDSASVKHGRVLVKWLARPEPIELDVTHHNRPRLSL